MEALTRSGPATLTATLRARTAWLSFNAVPVMRTLPWSTATVSCAPRSAGSEVSAVTTESSSAWSRASEAESTVTVVAAVPAPS